VACAYDAGAVKEELSEEGDADWRSARASDQRLGEDELADVHGRSAHTGKEVSISLHSACVRATSYLFFMSDSIAAPQSLLSAHSFISG
jgi:hypothetical protein